MRRQPPDYHPPSWEEQMLRLQRRHLQQKIFNLFIAAMGIAGWGLLLLFLWVATP